MATSNKDTTPKGRLTAKTLRRVTPDHVQRAIQRLLKEEVQHPFGKSTGYDVVTIDGRRLPPKAVFGLALMEALSRNVGPDDFHGGEHTPCFAAIRNAGFAIETKEIGTSAPPLDPEEREWLEGGRRRVTHLTIERSSAAAQYKKTIFKQEHGQLKCEHCGFIPSEKYGQDDGDACIEVHHIAQLSDLDTSRTTTLHDLICVCANCHRFLHSREHRMARKASR